MGHNGHQPHNLTPAGPPVDPAAVDAVIENYGHFAGQLGAINTLMLSIPLAEMAAAVDRMQSTGALQLPAMPPEQFQAIMGGLRGDRKVITAALQLQRVVRAVASQPPATR